MPVLVIDNKDSFTYNLVQYLEQCAGTEVLVLDHSCSYSRDILPLLERVSGVVLSPGPGSVQVPSDFGVSSTVLSQCPKSIPILGVCLGMQGLAYAHGWGIRPADTPIHGRTSVMTVHRRCSPLLRGIPQCFQAVQYNSLVVCAPAKPTALHITMTSDRHGGDIMGIEHHHWPHYGVQFHPESISSEHGHTMIRNFIGLCHASSPRIPRPVSSPPEPAPYTHTLHIQSLAECTTPTDTLFARFGGSIWLDSSAPDPRYSYLSIPGGSLSHCLSYRLSSHSVSTDHGPAVPLDASTTFFDLLDTRMRSYAVPPTPLGPGFLCGYAGYIGYEMRSVTLGTGPGLASDSAPDAAVVFVDRLLVYDHRQSMVYFVTLQPVGDTPRHPDWSAPIITFIQESSDQDESDPVAVHTPQWTARDSQESYTAKVGQCLQYITEGESYELCLTTRYEAQCHIADPLGLYRRLRALNPAPYSAFFAHGPTSILCSSPELLVQLQDSVLTCSPIKGTAKRDLHDPQKDAAIGQALQASDKNRAENLMIVDLLRNDMGRVSVPGSVTVPDLMGLYSFATVHHLISTIQSRVRPRVSPLECFQSVFPPGSMTGAPKYRSTELLQGLETGPRGVYSGALGYLSVTGDMQWNVVIRTLTLHNDTVSLGCGGAIVHQSDPLDEFHEMLLKANSVKRAL